MLSDEDLTPNTDRNTYRDCRNHTGFNQPILQFLGHKTYHPYQYKYIIVPGGSGLMSTSGLFDYR